MIQINGNCSGVPTSSVEMVIDNGHRYPVTVDGSRFSVSISAPEPSPFGAAMVCDGKQLSRLTVPLPGSYEADLPPVSMDPSSLAFGPAVVPVSKIGTSGRDFILNGQRWIWKGSTDFRFYQWFLDGRNMQDVYAQRRDAGANLLRVSGMYNGGIGQFIPSNYGNAYWDGLQPFLREAAAEGFQVEFTAFMDAQNMPGLSHTNEQQAHWGRLGSVLVDVPNVLVELVNEAPQNGVDPGQFGPLANLLCSRGSGLSDTAGYQPGWQYQTWHGRRDWPKVLFSSEDMWWVGEGVSASGQRFSPTMPVVHDEPIGFSDNNEPGRRSMNPYVARVLGLSSDAYGCGGTFHSDYGISSSLWSPRVESCARVFYAALG